MTDVTGVAIRVQPGALHSAAGLRPAGSISVSPVLLFQIKACALIWRGRRKERICSFRGAYSNRGNGMQRVSSDVGGCGLPHQRARWFAMTYSLGAVLLTQLPVANSVYRESAFELPAQPGVFGNQESKNRRSEDLLFFDCHAGIRPEQPFSYSAGTACSMICIRLESICAVCSREAFACGRNEPSSKPLITPMRCISETAAEA